MKLLIITQAVDRENIALGFFHRWIEEFARHVEQVEVICLYEGSYSLPANVRVHSLGKEKGAKNPFVYASRFYSLLHTLEGKYDTVFVHMNVEYIDLAGAYWRLQKIPVALWYVHRSVTLRLRFASLFANLLLTTTPTSIGLHGTKVRALGHGIDTEEFSSMPVPHINPKTPRLICVGRITPIKHIDTIIETLTLLRKNNIDATLTVVGSPAVSSDEHYLESLKERVRALGLEGSITFTGKVPHEQMPTLYAKHDISVNMAPVGLFDKVVLESLASGLIAVAANPAFGEYMGVHASDLICAPEPEAAAACISKLLARTDLSSMQEELRTAVGRADIRNLIPAIIEQYEAIR